MDQLLIVTTGGTIDKVYFDDKSDYQVGEPQIGHILEELGVAFRFRVIPIMRKDSLHIDAADRELLRATIAAQDEAQVLVTHGTDTMVETARVRACIAGFLLSRMRSGLLCRRRRASSSSCAAFCSK